MLRKNRTYFRYAIIFLLAFLPLLSYSQKKKRKSKKAKCETVSEQDLIKYASLSEVESSIKEAKGWAMQNNGAWYSMDNQLPYSDQKANRDKTGERQFGQDNFIVLEMRKLMIGNDQYNVIIKKYHDGKYEFPVLKEGWTPFNSLDYYVFSSKKLDAILPDPTPFNKKYAVNLDVFARGTIKDYDHKNWQSILVGNVQQVHLGEKLNGWNLILAVFPIKNKDSRICRFRFIKSFDNNYLTKIYTGPNNWERIFDYSFYEVKFHTFKSFIEGAKQNYIPVDKNMNLTNDPAKNFYNWGILKYQTGDYIKAIEYFEKTIEADPNPTDFMLYSYMGNAQSKLHRFNDAIGSYDRALEMKPSNVMDYSNWVRNYFNRGVAKYYLDDMKGACYDWHKALELGFGPAHDYLLEYCNEKEK